jgi:hypothetical protein
MLHVEETRAIRVSVVELLSHLDDRSAQARRVSGLRQNAFPNSFEGLTDSVVAGAIARPGERLVLPHPGAFLLVALKGRDRRDEKP